MSGDREQTKDAASRFGRQLEFINMTNQSAEEKRDRISKIRAVMMKDSHRTRRLGRDAAPAEAAKTVSRNASPGPASSAVRSLQGRSKSVDDSTSLADSSGHTSVFAESELSSAFVPSTPTGEASGDVSERLPLDTLSDISVSPPSPELVATIESWLVTDLPIADERHMICDAAVPVLKQPANIVSSILARTLISSMLIFNDVSKRQVFCPAVHQQQCQTIRLLNQALFDPTVVTQAPIIIAVSGIMANHFVVACNMAEFDVHAAGARRLVELKGGLREGLFDEVTRRSMELLQALRRLAAIILSDDAEPDHQRQLSVPRQRLSTDSMFTFGLSNLAGTSLQGSLDMLGVISDIQDAVIIVQVLQANNESGPVPSPRRTQASSRWQTLVWRALYEHWQHLSDQGSFIGATQELHKVAACRLALIIFVALADSNMLRSSNSAWSDGKILTDLVSRLRLHIQHTNQFDCWTPLPGALLWCLSIGAVASARTIGVDDMTGAWFRAHVWKVGIAYYYARDDLRTAAAESFNMIELGLRAASNLNSSA